LRFVGRERERRVQEEEEVVEGGRGGKRFGAIGSQEDWTLDRAWEEEEEHFSRAPQRAVSERNPKGPSASWAVFTCTC
jgi:hypothetical protein